MANLSPGAQRAYTLVDVLAAINQTAENAGNPDLAIDNAFTILVTKSETGIINDIVMGGIEFGSGMFGTRKFPGIGGRLLTVTAFANGTWGLCTWGSASWNS